jgi:hypothetical protein
VAGLKGSLVVILRVSGVGVWGSIALAGLRSRAGGSDIPWCVKQWSTGLWAGAWHAVPAILLVYSGVEKPSTN